MSEKTYTYKTAHARRLREMGANIKMCDWADTQPSMAVAWKECKRGDRMLWLAGKFAGPPMSDSRRTLALATVRCARLVEHLGADEVKACNDLTERFGLGEDITEEELGAAADAAADAAAEAAIYTSYAAADAAAEAAIYTSYAAYTPHAAYTAVYAADAAYAAVDAGAAFTADSEDEMQSKCADIAREVYPEPPGEWGDD